MAHSPRRITRKDIRRPDWFVTQVRQFSSFFSGHKKESILGATALVVVLLALWGWGLYRDRQDRLAAMEYSRAIDLYHDGKYREALEALTHLAIYRSSYYGRVGLLYQAHSYMALGEMPQAVAAFQDLLAKEKKEPLLRQAAYMSLGYAQEKMEKCQEATRSYAEAEKIEGPAKADATMGKARCSAQTGNFAEALNSYRKFLTDNPVSDRIGQVSLLIQELEGKVGEGSAGAAK